MAKNKESKGSPRKSGGSLFGPVLAMLGGAAVGAATQVVGVHLYASSGGGKSEEQINNAALVAAGATMVTGGGTAALTKGKTRWFSAGVGASGVVGLAAAGTSRLLSSSSEGPRDVISGGRNADDERAVEAARAKARELNEARPAQQFNGPIYAGQRAAA